MNTAMKEILEVCKSVATNEESLSGKEVAIKVTTIIVSSLYDEIQNKQSELKRVERKLVIADLGGHKELLPTYDIQIDKLKSEIRELMDFALIMGLNELLESINQVKEAGIERGR